MRLMFDRETKTLSSTDPTSQLRPSHRHLAWKSVRPKKREWIILIISAAIMSMSAWAGVSSPSQVLGNQPGKCWGGGRGRSLIKPSQVLRWQTDRDSPSPHPWPLISESLHCTALRPSQLIISWEWQTFLLSGKQTESTHFNCTQ